ncbi:MAG: hypothetical protein M3Y32_11570 [Pseudomonadota bacterium]|nr:hypothetical protein [Pseudomonadota bacterium]
MSGTIFHYRLLRQRYFSFLAELIVNQDTPDTPPDGTSWSRARRPLRPEDQALNGPARRWLRDLPPRRRPLRLASRHPRIVNRIAWCWADPLLSAQVLEDLLVDRRGGRSGFGAGILQELRRLQRFRAERTRSVAPSR